MAIRAQAFYSSCRNQVQRCSPPCFAPSTYTISSRRCQVSWRQRCPPLEAAKTRVPSTEAAVLLESGLPYLDVRTVEEFSEGHAPGAVNIPLLVKAADGLVPNPDFVAQVQQQFPDVEEEIVVGYTNLIDDAGGWLGWVDAGLPVVRPGC